MSGKRLLGYLSLVAVCGLLYYYALIVGFGTNLLSGALLAIAFIGLLRGFYLEKDVLSAQVAASTGGSAIAKDLRLFASVFIGAVVSYWLNVNMGLGAVVGAAIVGVVAAVLLPSYGVPLYCGAFAGMASPKVLDMSGLVLAGLIAGVIFVLAQDVFNGYGGKLGTIACGGCLLSALVNRKPLLSAAVPGWDVGRAILLTSVVSAVLTYIVNVRMGKGAVMASGIVGLVGGLILPKVFPEIGATLAVVCICASFAGMSAKSRIPCEWLMAGAGVIVGLAYIYSSPYLGGAGGKLGTTAFGAVIAVNALSKAFQGVSAGVGKKG